MKLMTGDMQTVFDQVDHYIVCTSSNLKNKSNELIMLNGLGGELAKKYPNMPLAIGTWIKENHGDCGVYGLRCASKVGVFQNKILERHGNNLGTISFSAKMLKALAEANPNKVYALEAPNSGDPWFMVEGILQTLPDNVQVWRNG